MKKYRVHVTNSVTGVIDVEANSPEEAEDYAASHLDELEPMGDDWEEYEVEEIE